MTVNIISCVVNHKNNLAIGRNGGLLVHLVDDLKNFKNITTNRLLKESFLDRNVVLMGRKTWFSIPRENRPLKNRLNLVLTRDTDLLKLSPFPKKVKQKANYDKDVYFITYDEFEKFYECMNPNVFVIGGGEIYNNFLKSEKYRPSNVFLTEVYGYKGLEPDTFISGLTQEYRLISVSDKIIDKDCGLSFRFLEYRYFKNFKTDENKYLDVLRDILATGNMRGDRTGVGTVSVFGKQIEFDISTNIPLLTSKRVPWKHAIHELLWFMRGDTDAKILQKSGVKIWDGNTSREFLDNRGLHHYEPGILGPGYGWQWRFFGAEYNQCFSDTSQIDTCNVGGFDQLKYVIETLKTDPFSRRIMMSYWNPPDLKKSGLPPCHYSCIFYVEEENNQKYLSCLFTMRSNDLLLGNPFNIFSYAVLTYILALKCDMKPRKLVYVGADVHIYKNHVDQMNEQLKRTPRPLPKLRINPDVKNKFIKDITIDDFDIIGYFPHGSIKAPMAV